MQPKKNDLSRSLTFKTELPMNTRRLKIQPKYVERTYKTIYQPVITLTGQWLRDLGFECNNHVLVEEKKGCLTIRLVQPESPVSGLDT